MTIPQYSPSIRVVQRARRDKNIPPAPKTFADLIIPHHLQNTVTNQKFLLDNHRQRLFIFASKDQLEFLNSWHCDGTFAVSVYGKLLIS